MEEKDSHNSSVVAMCNKKTLTDVYDSNNVSRFYLIWEICKSFDAWKSVNVNRETQFTKPKRSLLFSSPENITHTHFHYSDADVERKFLHYLLHVCRLNHFHFWFMPHRWFPIIIINVCDVCSIPVNSRIQKIQLYDWPYLKCIQPAIIIRK